MLLQLKNMPVHFKPISSLKCTPLLLDFFYFVSRYCPRYQIILQIFHNHARTNEAKLQLALAEIPYLRVKLSSFSHTFDSSLFPDIERVGGDGETFMEVRRRILN
ncbi:hypothetical protein AVEN_271698-1, partial [Araneus ventricosus]